MNAYKVLNAPRHMAIIRTKEIRKLSASDQEKKLGELNLEIAKERANISIGASTISPGKIREMRKAIARIKTIQKGKVSPEK